MCTDTRLPDVSAEPLKTTLKRFCIVVVFSIAFAYIEAAVVVYLREIFYPDGFAFRLEIFGIDALWERFLFTEIGREAATIVLIFSGAWLCGRNLQQRVAYFLTIFAVWDIFYYVWLKVLLNWPASITDWDILFLIPIVWASPVLYPVLISITFLVFSAVILYRDACARPLKPSLPDLLAFALAGLIVVVSFCIAGQHVSDSDFESYFHWPLFAAGHLFAIAVFVKCLLKSK